MEDHSNPDGPKTSNSIGQEACASTERTHFRTHLPEQECEPLSEQNLQERVKLLESQIEIYQKMLQVCSQCIYANIHKIFTSFL